MKKKTAVTALTIVCVLACAFVFAACDNIVPNPPQHIHNYQWTDNGDGTHSRHCSVEGCDAPDVNVECHVYGVDNKCEKCKAVKPSGEIHAHDYKLKYDETHHWLRCDVSGCTEKTKYIAAHDTNGNDGGCSVCGYKSDDTNPPIPPEHKHTYSDEWTSAGAEGHYRLANCEHTDEHTELVPHVYDGDTDATCNICGYVRTIVISHTHSWAESWQSDEAHHWHECAASGCTITDNSQKYGYAEHNFTNGDCVCGKTKQPTAGLKYMLSSDGKSYSVTGIGMATKTDIIIASEYNGKPVTSIGSNAFNDCSNITSVNS